MKNKKPKIRVPLPAQPPKVETPKDKYNRREENEWYNEFWKMIKTAKNYKSGTNFENLIDEEDFR